jgi:hypothetical protein
MPGKSRHGKGKRYHYSKKGKSLQRQATGTAPAAAVNASEVPTQSAPAALKPMPKAAAAPLRAAENPYPYITSELRRIAILAGIIIVILIVLSITLA